MVMQERSRRLAEPLRWGKREKTATAAVLACLALALIGLGAYALTSGSPARADCIKVTFASTLGGAEVHTCGSQARKICASGSFRSIEQEMRVACGRAGFPYRAPSRRVPS
jgi:hypothetical protein